MKSINISIGFIFLLGIAFGQNGLPQKYIDLIKQAEAFYKAEDYKKSASAYSDAFKENGWKGLPNDRYNAACSWAMAQNPDSALFNLMRIAAYAKFADYGRVISDSDLAMLHEDKRWKTFLDLVKQNKEKAEEGLNKPLAHQLDSIHIEDQQYRLQMDEVGKKYGWQSKEMKDLWKIANYHDSVNLIRVKAILDKNGWLGPDVVGQSGNMTLFLVIQHSDQITQEKYLPMMREAAKTGKAAPSSLALLEDRVALGQGKKQIYGSQIGQTNDGKHYVLPLEDPDNVDKRRAQVGLGPLNDYTMHWNFKWDAEAYKKEAAENNGPCEILSLKADTVGQLSWDAKNVKGNDKFLVEQFRWNKWIKVGEVYGLPGLAITQYSFKVTQHSGDNLSRVALLNDSTIFKVIKWTTKTAKVNYTIDQKNKTITFSDETAFQILDSDNKIIKMGIGKNFIYNSIPAGKYTLNYDNSSVEIKL